MSILKSDWNPSLKPEDGLPSRWSADAASCRWRSSRRAGSWRRLVFKSDHAAPLMIILVIVTLGLTALDRHRRLGLERERADSLARQLEVAVALNEGRSPPPSTRSIHIVQRPVWGASASGRDKADSFPTARVPTARSDDPAATRRDRETTTWLAFPDLPRTNPSPSSTSPDQSRASATPAAFGVASVSADGPPLPNLENLEQSLGRRLAAAAFAEAMGWQTNRDQQRRLGLELPRDVPASLELAWKTWSLLQSAQRLAGWAGNRRRATPGGDMPSSPASASESSLRDQEPWTPPPPIALNSDRPTVLNSPAVPAETIHRDPLESDLDQAPAPPILAPRTIPWPGRFDF